MDEIIKEIIHRDCFITLPWDPFHRKFSLGINNGNKYITDNGYSSLDICGQQAAAVFWSEGKISTIKTTVNTNIFSFEFSGCAMARYKIGKQEYAAHIHSSRSADIDCRNEWIDYVSQQNIISLRMFAPQTLQTVDYCWGLISKEGHCYSIGVIQCECYDIYTFNKTKTHVPIKYKVVYIREHLVGNTIFDYRPILGHGMKLQLGQMENPDYLRRRQAATRSQWEMFWKQIRYKDWLRFTCL